MLDSKNIDFRSTFSKKEKLKSRKLIHELFTEGIVTKSYPIRIRYMIYNGDTHYPIKVGVSVSKRNFKRAVDRNRVKRMLREGYRLYNIRLKNAIHESNYHLCMMIIYTDRKIPTSQKLHVRIEKCLEKIALDIKEKTIKSRSH